MCVRQVHRSWNSWVCVSRTGRRSEPSLFLCGISAETKEELDAGTTEELLAARFRFKVLSLFTDTMKVLLSGSSGSTAECRVVSMSGKRLLLIQGVILLCCAVTLLLKQGFCSGFELF